MLQVPLRWYHWILLCAILLLGVALRCNNLGSNSLWIDEFLSLECSSGWGRYDLTLNGSATQVPDFISLKNAKSIPTVWRSISEQENHPPLYFVLLRIWREAFGDSAIAIRSLSVVASVISLLLLFTVGTICCSARAGLWSSLLMAVAIPQIQQAQDARSYMPFTAACLAAALALVLIQRFGPTLPRCIALCTFALVASLMHYMALATVLALMIYAALYLRDSARRAALYSLVTAIILFCLVWGPAMFSQHFRMIDATDWLAADSAHPLISILKNLCTLPTRLFLDLDFDKTNLPIACLGATALLMPLLLLKRYPQLTLWYFWMMVPILIALAIDLCTQRASLSMVKYTLASAPGMYLMLGFLAARVGRAGWIPALVIAGCCMVSLSSAYAPRLPDWREVAKFIDRNSASHDPILFVDQTSNPFANGRLLSVSYYLANQQRPLYLIDRPPVAQVRIQLAKVRHACVIADCCNSLNRPVIPGLTLGRSDFLYRMAVVGSIDPAGAKLANAAPVSLLIDH